MVARLIERLENNVATRVAREFSDRVLRNSLNKSVLMASAGPVVETGHPEFEDLPVGGMETCEMVSVFLDLSNFTGRTFWDDSRETAELAHAVLTAFADVVQQLGGHVLGLRGDGLYAGFGPSTDDRIAGAAALVACAASLDAIENTLNPELKARGVQPLQARAGIDYGETTFVRSGTSRGSEVNIIGFAPNFAAKCEKKAASWEVVAGEEFQKLIGPAYLLSRHPDSPKTYQRDYQKASYEFYNCSWRPLVAEIDSTIEEISGRALLNARF